MQRSETHVLEEVNLTNVKNIIIFNSLYQSNLGFQNVITVYCPIAISSKDPVLR